MGIFWGESNTIDGVQGLLMRDLYSGIIPDGDQEICVCDRI